MNPNKVVCSKPRGLTTADKPVNVSLCEWRQIQATVNRGPRPEEIASIRRAQVRYHEQLKAAAQGIKLALDDGGTVELPVTVEG